MTIEAGTRRAGPYATNGVQTAFVFEFKVFAAADLVVTETTAGVDTIAMLTTEYTVALNADQDVDPGGTVTYLVAPDGPTITIISAMPITQPAVFTNTGGFYPRVLNDSLDRATIIQQQQAELLTRTPVAPVGGGIIGQYPVLNASGGFDYSDGTTTDAALRANLAAATGLGLVGVQRSGTTWAQAKTALDYVLEDAVSITETGAVQDFDHGTGIGTDNSTVNLDNLLADTKVGAIFIPPGEKGFKITKTLLLGTSQRIVGSPNPSAYVANKTNALSKIAYRPSGADKIAISHTGAVNSNGQSVLDIALDLNNVTHTAVQFAGCYGNAIVNLHLFGTMNWGVVLHDNYVSQIDGLFASGLASFKTGSAFIGIFNDIYVGRVHLSALPINATDRTWGVLSNGAGAGLEIDHCVSQGQTVGIGVISNGTKDVLIRQPYFENTVCDMIFGTDADGPLGVEVIGGAYGSSYAGHPQHAKRGPLVWARGGTALRFHPTRLDETPNAAGANGPWPFLTGSGLTSIEIVQPSIFGGSTPDDLLMRQNAGDSPGYYIRGYNGGGHQETIELRKRAGSFGANGAKSYIDGTPAWVLAAYQPALIGGTVDALLSAAAPTAASVVL